MSNPYKQMKYSVYLYINQSERKLLAIGHWYYLCWIRCSTM